MASFCLPAARRFRGWALTACLLAAGSPAQAQSRFDSWTIEDGLPQNSVNDIHQTRDGYLWLAAFGGLGAVRAAYREAVATQYRFLSYGDAMWLPERRS